MLVISDQFAGKFLWPDDSDCPGLGFCLVYAVIHIINCRPPPPPPPPTSTKLDKSFAPIFIIMHIGGIATTTDCCIPQIRFAIPRNESSKSIELFASRKEWEWKLVLFCCGCDHNLRRKGIGSVAVLIIFLTLHEPHNWLFTIHFQPPPWNKC